MTLPKVTIAAVLAAGQVASSQTRVGPLTTTARPPLLASSPQNWDSQNTALKSVCTGAVDLQTANARGIPRLDSDSSQEDGPWSLAALDSGLPCNYSISSDRTRLLVLVMTGRESYYVLFFNQEALVRAQMIHGPWNLGIRERERFPPRLEQLAEGDAGFLYSFDAKTGYYREEPYPYPEGYEDD